MTTIKTSYSNVSAANPDVIFDISKIKNRNHLTFIGIFAEKSASINKNSVTKPATLLLFNTLSSTILLYQFNDKGPLSQKLLSPSHSLGSKRPERIRL